ncbi:hypothetical protein [Yinghuangia soli]|uniref:Uncharacterized protein n=1 Tax=Yinghuangia soli TaxID=2908204 RepID=A0AA41Q5T5_9ACTN|nr:hypothetical protein [Yinghuangia soli]MCF2532099.1 hypothetical protein [Yinghuangia soli]
MYEFTDLDQAPPGRTWSAGAGVWRDDSVRLKPLGGARIVTLPKEIPLSYEACSARLSTHGKTGDSIAVESGTQACLSTEGGRVVGGTVTAISSIERHARMRLTIWERS